MIKSPFFASLFSWASKCGVLFACFLGLINDIKLQIFFKMLILKQRISCQKILINI